MFWMKSKTYNREVIGIANNTAVRFFGLLASISSDISILSYSNIYNSYKLAFVALMNDSFISCCPAMKLYSFFRGKFSSQLSLIAIYFV